MCSKNILQVAFVCISQLYIYSYRYTYHIPIWLNPSTTLQNHGSPANISIFKAVEATNCSILLLLSLLIVIISIYYHLYIYIFTLGSPTLNKRSPLNVSSFMAAGDTWWNILLQVLSIHFNCIYINKPQYFLIYFSVGSPTSSKILQPSAYNFMVVGGTWWDMPSQITSLIPLVFIYTIAYLFISLKDHRFRTIDRSSLAWSISYS